MPTAEKCLIKEHSQVAKDLYEIQFISTIASECKAGQFVHVLPSKTLDPLLRRPISLYDVDKENNIISLLYKVVGKGTEQLTRARVNDYVDVMGPLGKGFTISENKNVVLVGGGVGIAPLVYLARKLKESHCKITVLYGVENEEQLVAVPKLKEIGADILIATVDGSNGYKGYVTELINELNYKEIDYLYTCGPEIMMANVAQYALEHDIKAEVSLEEHMACGVGACLGCARKLKKDDHSYVKVCKDGPVFLATDIEI